MGRRKEAMVLISQKQFVLGEGKIPISLRNILFVSVYR